FQAPSSREAPSSKPRTAALPLELDVWNFSGAWSLEFGASMELQLKIDSPRCLRHNHIVKNPTALSRRGFAELLGAGAAYAALRPALGLSESTPNPTETKSSDVVRLSSNENPYGPSPAALKAMTAAFPLAWKYPDET